jgi:2,5-diketo-D-gluconate reductase B
MKSQNVKQLEVQGRRVPALGLGTWQMTGARCQEAVETALDLGYRHVDTARMYGNEDEVGRAIERSGVPREEVFLTTKVFLDELSRERVPRAVEDSLVRLRSDWIDLLLLHWPSDVVPAEESLDALRELERGGLVRHLGVSNYTPSQLDQAFRRNMLLCNQVEYHPFLAQQELLGMCRERGMFLTAYSPLAHGRVVQDPTLSAIGERHGRTSSQVALRWLMQQESVAAIPKASSREHLEENLQVFDFALSAEEMAEVHGLARGLRTVDPEFAPAWGR